MTGVIKASSAAMLVRSLESTASRHEQSLVAPIARPHPAELAPAAADHEIAKLEAELAKVRAEAVDAVEEAHALGRQDGLEEAREDEERRLATLAQGIDRARAAWDTRLAGLDVLAVMLATGALARIFVEAEDLNDLVTRAIARRVESIGSNSIVAIRISERDFPDATAVDKLRARSGTAAMDIIVDPTFRAGDCRLDLQLGAIDLGIGSQWTELERFLSALEQDALSG